jgi:hypothetical protein
MWRHMPCRHVTAAPSCGAEEPPMRHALFVALLLLPSAATTAAHGGSVEAATDTEWLTRRELEVESGCDRHQRARPCRTAQGATDFQCVATSPLAAVLHWFEADAPPDPTVRRVETIHRERRAEAVRRVEKVPSQERGVRAEAEGGRPSPASAASGVADPLAAPPLADPLAVDLDEGAEHRPRGARLPKEVCRGALR